MFASALRLVCVSLLLSSAMSCYWCFVGMSVSRPLCYGHIYTKHNVRNVDRCFKKLDKYFNYNQKVLDASRVGAVTMQFSMTLFSFYL